MDRLTDSMKARRRTAVVCTAALAVGVVWVNYNGIQEAYGDGPPYYGRTTNMDKWSSPVPYLATLDVIAAGAIAGLWRWASTRRN